MENKKNKTRVENSNYWHSSQQNEVFIVWSHQLPSLHTVSLIPKLETFIFVKNSEKLAGFYPTLETDISCLRVTTVLCRRACVDPIPKEKNLLSVAFPVFLLENKREEEAYKIVRNRNVLLSVFWIPPPPNSLHL